jgi:ABC-type branched-subunit amino acid transport system substrate-binding protein
MSRRTSRLVKRTILSICVVLTHIVGIAQADAAGLAKPTHVGIALNPDDRFFLIQKPIYNGIRLFFDGKSDYAIDLISTADDLDGQRKAAQETVKRSLRFVIGHNFSGLSEAYLRALPKDYPVTYVTPFATSTGLTSVRDNVYLVWPDNERQIRALVAFTAKNKISTKNIVTVVNESETYSVDMANLFADMLVKKGSTPTKVSYIRDSFNAKAMAEKIKKLEPTLLFLPIYNRELIELYQALWEASADRSKMPVVICGDTVGTEEDFFKMLGNKVRIPSDRFFFTNGFAKELLAGNLAKFAAMYRKKFGEDPNAGAVAGYQAAQVMHALIQKKGNKHPRSIDVAGWLGTFDAHNRLLRPLVLNEISSAGFKMREVIND